MYMYVYIYISNIQVCCISLCIYIYLHIHTFNDHYILSGNMWSFLKQNHWLSPFGDKQQPNLRLPVGKRRAPLPRSQNRATNSSWGSSSSSILGTILEEKSSFIYHHHFLCKVSPFRAISKFEAKQKTGMAPYHSCGNRSIDVIIPATESPGVTCVHKTYIEDNSFW